MLSSILRGLTVYVFMCLSLVLLTTQAVILFQTYHVIYLTEPCFRIALFQILQSSALSPAVIFKLQASCKLQAVV